MSNHIRNYEIRVTKNGPDYRTELLENNTPITNLRFNKNQNGMKKTSHYQLNFTIDDKSLSNDDKIIFAPSDNDVLAVSTDLSKCPANGSQMLDTFWVDKNQPSRLRVINMDLKVQEFRFKINMVKRSDPASRPFIELDPIVTNGNQGSAEPLVAYSLTPILTGGIVGLGTAALLGASLVSTGLVYAIGGAVVGLIVGAVLDRL